MKLGVSLPLSYFAGTPDDPWTAALGAPATGLAELQRAGVAAIELRPLRRNAPPELALAAARQVWDTGLTLTVHGALPDRAAGPSPELEPPLRALAPELARRGESLVVTVHAYAAADTSLTVLAERTLTAARDWLATATAAGLPVRLALELNRAQAHHDPGADYASLLAMHAQLAEPRAGFCWDFGHAYHNVRQGRLPAEPPPAFLAQVIHTHVHDLGPADRTHWPLTMGVVPLARWVGLLAAAGYRGVLDLELEPGRFAGHPLRPALFASLALLAAVVQHGSRS